MKMGVACLIKACGCGQAQQFFLQIVLFSIAPTLNTFLVFWIRFGEGREPKVDSLVSQMFEATSRFVSLDIC